MHMHEQRCRLPGHLRASMRALLYVSRLYRYQRVNVEHVSLTYAHVHACICRYLYVHTVEMHHMYVCSNVYMNELYT